MVTEILAIEVYKRTIMNSERLKPSVIPSEARTVEFDSGRISDDFC